MAGYKVDQNGNRYQLKGGKHACPGCNQRTLQLYISETDGEPVNEEVGKCDRHNNCGYDLDPWAYFEEHPDELPEMDKAARRRRKSEAKKPLVTIPKKYVLDSMATAEPGRCDFIDILLNMFNREDVERVCKLYYLGVTRNKSVIFWQIDEDGFIHEGKAMAYIYHTGGRDKTSWATGKSKWIFSTLQSDGLLPHDASSTKIMFGQHLLASADNKTNVCITESEKNAIFGSLVFPSFTWLGVGSRDDIGKVRKARKALAKCRSVILVPDSDAITEWEEKAKDFKIDNMMTWNLCKEHPHGYDLGDFIRDLWLQEPGMFKRSSPDSTETTAPASPTPTGETDDDEGKMETARRIVSNPYPYEGDLKAKAEYWRAQMFIETFTKAEKVVDGWNSAKGKEPPSGDKIPDSPDEPNDPPPHSATSVWAYSPHTLFKMLEKENPSLARSRGEQYYQDLDSHVKPF